MQTAHVFFSGFVQGVGFRSFIRQTASKHGVTGWVTNLPDRRVEAVFQKDKKETIENVIQECKHYVFADIQNVEVEWKDGEEKYEDFVVIK